MFNRSTTRILLALISLLVSGSWALAKKTGVTSSLDPAVVTLGQLATYTVSVEGKEQPKRFNIPTVAGLTFTYIGASQNIKSSIENNKAEYVLSVSYKFRVLAQKTGEFTIPSYFLEINQEKLRVTEAKLTVLPSDEKNNATSDEIAFLELECPQRLIYVGQMAVCSLKLYVLATISDVEFLDLNQSGDAFSKGNIASSAQQSGERRQGFSYQVFSLPVGVTPLKAGAQEIEYEMSLRVVLPQQQRKRSRSRDLFDQLFRDDFFDFNRLRDRRQLTLSTGKITLDIQPLPEEGKPEHFNGAIGLFSIKQDLSAQEIQAGDPLTLKIEISGAGNFERLQPPFLKVDQNWKSYTPKTAFTPLDELSSQGTKTFDYVLIPQAAEITESPPLQFSFFDPMTAEYVDLSPRPISLEVRPAPANPTIYALPSALTQSEGDSDRSLSSQKKNLLGIKLLSATWVSGLQPAFRTPSFLVAQLVPLFLLTGIYWVRKRQLRLRHDLSYARRLRANKSMHRWLREARKAVDRNDAVTFYAAAQRAIQESLGRHFAHSTETLTLVEIEGFLQGCDGTSALIEKVGRFFHTADGIKFAGRGAEEYSLKGEEKSLLALLAKLTALR